MAVPRGMQEQLTGRTAVDQAAARTRFTAVTYSYGPNSLWRQHPQAPSTFLP